MLPLSAYDAAELATAARRTDQRWLLVDLAGAGSRQDVLAAIARAAGFPKHFGMNLDALYDCVTDLKPIGSADRPGFVVVLRDLPPGQQLAPDDLGALLDVFRDAADHFFDQGVAFRVFYSVRRTA
ncbi:MAG: barstar family protein [Burkholderiaceae bacterium]|nr:barstar family protein [Burkholderiaceae bacterium]